MDLRTRLESLEINLYELDPEIIVLSEHNMTEEELGHINIKYYSVISQYSRTTTSGGGVVILSREGVKAKQLVFSDVSDLCTDKVFECTVVKFKCKNFSFILAGIYRKPQYKNKEFLERLNSLIEFLIDKEKYLIVAGDFNINILERSPESKELDNILTRHGMTFLIDFPTRITTTSESCIDNFLTNINKSDTQSSGIITLLSDHDAQLVELLDTQVEIKKNLTFTTRDFSENNIELFKKFLGSEN